MAFNAYRSRYLLRKEVVCVVKKMVKLILRYPIMVVNHIFLYFYYRISKKGKYTTEGMFSEKKQNVLVFSPHVDDESIGLGATLIKHSKNGDKITCVYVSDGGASDTSLSKEEIIALRKEEAKIIKQVIGFENIVFLERPDGKVKAEQTLIDEILNQIEQAKPDIVYTPFFIDGHTDHIETTTAVTIAMKKWDENFSNIYMYEINNPITSELVNSLCIMNYELYEAKKELLHNFKSQKVMGFDAFLSLNRMKRLIGNKGYGAEVFVNTNVKGLTLIHDSLEREEFKPSYFRQISSEYNLLISFMKSYSIKKIYNRKIADILKDIEGDIKKMV